jgi:hypothetical protein
MPGSFGGATERTDLRALHDRHRPGAQSAKTRDFPLFDDAIVRNA